MTYSRRPEGPIYKFQAEEMPYAPHTNEISEVPTTRTARQVFEALGLRPDRAGTWVGSLPFSAQDVTAGSESELQAVVVGDKNSVDLPLTIERSNYYANIARRVAA